MNDQKISRQLSILGIGWLGLPLAKFLIEKGFKIKGSTTTQTKLEVLKTNTIDPFLISLNEEGVNGELLSFLSGSDTLIINIPPGLRKNPEKNHVLEIKHLIETLEKSDIKHVIYISSTSVFKDSYDFRNVNNSTQPDNLSKPSKQLIEIENEFRSLQNINTTILRFGGLFDDERHPAKQLSGRKNISNPEAPINLIHKTDCIGIIYKLITYNIWNTTLNAVYPFHPTRKSYYTSYCKKHKLNPITFNMTERSKGKVVDSTSLVQLLDYDFKMAP